MTTAPDKPAVGIFSLTGCAGDQLAILNAEPQLLALAERVHIVTFDMAVSRAESW